MEELFFTYGPYAEPDYVFRVLGRKLDPREATLSGYRLIKEGLYFALIEEVKGEAHAESGKLYPLQAGDSWLIEAHFGVERGDYRWKTVEVTTAEGGQKALTLVRGPLIGTWPGGQDEPAEGT